MKLLAVFLLVTTACAQLVRAQSESEMSYCIHVGGGFPYKPQPFYDLWAPGITAGGGVSFAQSRLTSLSVMIDFGSFPLDKERFLKALGLPSDNNTLSGYRTSILSLTGNAKYVWAPSDLTSLYVVGGAGVLVTTTSAGEASYSGYEVSQSGETHAAGTASAGLGMEWTLAASLDLYTELRYAYSFPRNNNANTDYIPLRMGLRIPMK
ncbi:MAG TPA: outer membrane beta-barrel protein [Bacteroidota bacterium]